MDPNYSRSSLRSPYLEVDGLAFHVLSAVALQAQEASAGRRRSTLGPSLRHGDDLQSSYRMGNSEDIREWTTDPQTRRPAASWPLLSPQDAMLALPGVQALALPGVQAFSRTSLLEGLRHSRCLWAELSAGLGV